MGIMKLARFFRRFDSARDRLDKMSDRHWSLGKSSGADRVAYQIYSGTGMYNGSKRFNRRRGDVIVLFGGLCYVPWGLTRNIKFAKNFL